MAVFLARMVMPRSRSSSLESITRSTWASLARKVPLWLSMASTRVVLPWSTCAMMAILRRLLLKTTVLPVGGTACNQANGGLRNRYSQFTIRAEKAFTTEARRARRGREMNQFGVAIGFTSILLLLGAAVGQQSAVTPESHASRQSSSSESQSAPCRPQRPIAMTPFDVCKYLPLGPGRGPGIHAPRVLS